MELARSEKTALVIGGKGEIMQQCLQHLVASDNYSKIIVFNQSKLKINHTKLHFQPWALKSVKPIFNTIEGNDIYIDRSIISLERVPENRPKIIHSIIEFCKVAIKKGATQCIFCTSANSGETSNFHISRSYAELEKQISELPFWAVHIFRPSIILTEPIKNNFGEKIAARLGKGLDFVTGGLISRYSPIEAEKVASSMVAAAQKTKGGISYYQNEQIAIQSTRLKK